MIIFQVTLALCVMTIFLGLTAPPNKDVDDDYVLIDNKQHSKSKSNKTK